VKKNAEIKFISEPFGKMPEDADFQGIPELESNKVNDTKKVLLKHKKLESFHKFMK
jgi:hypothetical protein